MRSERAGAPTFVARDLPRNRRGRFFVAAGALTRSLRLAPSPASGRGYKRRAGSRGGAFRCSARWWAAPLPDPPRQTARGRVTRSTSSPERDRILLSPIQFMGERPGGGRLGRSSILFVEPRTRSYPTSPSSFGGGASLSERRGRPWTRNAARRNAIEFSPLPEERRGRGRGRGPPADAVRSISPSLGPFHPQPPVRSPSTSVRTA